MNALVALLSPIAFLFLRIILAVMFIDSGRRHVLQPRQRAESLGLPVWFTILLGLIEICGGLLITVGLYTQAAVFFLAGVMVGAIFFKLFVWKTGMYGEKNDGWYYDALLLAGVGMLFVLGAGSLSIDAILF